MDTGATAQRTWRYSVGTRGYDLLSGEWPIYRVGRLAAIDALDLSPGDRVLDLCCGTGLNLPLLREGVGESGTVVGVDNSRPMLARARARVRRARWRNVELIEADARELDAGTAPLRFDAVVATYALSVVPEHERVWRRLLTTLRTGGTAAVADLGLPSGRARPWRPLARLACWAGAADPSRQTWRLVDRDLATFASRRLRGGHVVMRAGRLAGARRG